MTESRRKTYEQLRSARWMGAKDLRSFGHRSRTKQMGFAAEDYTGKPVIAILNTWSEMNPCHYHFRERAAEVKRGVWQAGGFPVEMPAISLGEPFMKPSTMLYRNLLAMETEELLRANPIDGVVLLGGCDKTVPALVMGALSMNLPAIFVPAGPMLRGNWHNQPLGSGSDVWKYWAELRAGNIDEEDWRGIEDGIARSFGTCMTMGTASTMAAVTEALGLTLPGASSIPAADSSHARMASASGRCIVEMVWEDLKPRDIATASALGRVLANQGDHLLHLVHDSHQEGNAHVVVAFLEFADELLLRWVLQYHGGFIEVFSDVFEGIEDVHRPRAEKSLGACHLAVQQLIPHRWRIAILRSEGTTYTGQKNLSTHLHHPPKISSTANTIECATSVHPSCLMCNVDDNRPTPIAARTITGTNASVANHGIRCAIASPTTHRDTPP